MPDKLSLYAFIILLIIGFSFSVSRLESRIQRLQADNQAMIYAKQAQESVIDIADESQERDKRLTFETTANAQKIRAQVLAKGQQDFIYTSKCIFDNFGTREYVC